MFGSAAGSAGLALGRFLIGIGFGGAITVIMLLAMRWAPPERFATVAATAIASASLLGGLLGTAPLAVALERLGWTLTFVAIALLTAVTAMLFLVVVRDAPESDRVRARNAEPGREPARSAGDPGGSQSATALDHGGVHDRAVRLRGWALGRSVSAGRARPRPRAGELRAAWSGDGLQPRHARLWTARSPFRRPQRRRDAGAGLSALCLAVLASRPACRSGRPCSCCTSPWS